MQSTVDGLLHDAASLHRFISFVCEYSKAQESAQTYLVSSIRFFEDVRDLGRATKEYLPPFLERASKSPRRIATQRQKLVAIKRCWRVLHYFVKLAADAPTLNVPVSLQNLFQDRLHEIESLRGVDIVILLCADLNYFQHRHGPLKKLVGEVQGIIGYTKPLLTGLGFIAMPYSQSSNLITNTLICHELGHFVFEELLRGSALRGPIDGALKKHLGASFEFAPDRIKDWCRKQLGTWAEEIFCDIFALSLVGPVFSFASIELFSLLGLLDEKESLRFSPSHPADACRFKEHLAQLEFLGWWQAVKDVGSEHIKLIEELGKKPETSYEFALEGNLVLGQTLKDAFCDVRQDIRRLVNTMCAEVRSGLDDFRRHNRTVQEYLSRGIVPSTLAIRGRLVHPEPVGVINALACFYLSSLPRLIRNAPKYYRRRNSDRKISDRSELTSRLETWGTKAIEDYRLLHPHRKVE
jgi:hypothetical protein